MILHCCLWCLFAYIPSMATGTILATAPGTFELVHSDVLNGNGNKSGNIAPAYFGYDVAFQGKRLLIGAPKRKNASSEEQCSVAQLESPASNCTAMGNVISCRVHASLNTRCRSVAPPNAEPGDAFGLSLDVLPDASLSICSPTKEMHCGVLMYRPGFCYRSRNGRRWVPGPKTATKDSYCERDLDLMFVLDGSSSITSKNFTLVKDWTKKMASYFSIDSGFARIGVVQYSHYYIRRSRNNQKYLKTEVELGACQTIECFDRKVDAIQQFGHTTYTAHALNKTVRDFQSSDRFRSKETSKVLILLTDGDSTDGELLPQTADYVRSRGITTFAVGVGKYNESELRTIATGNLTSRKNVFTVADFSDLEKIVGQLKAAIITVTLEGDSNSRASSFKLQLGEMGFSMQSGKIARIVTDDCQEPTTPPIGLT